MNNVTKQDVQILIISKHEQAEEALREVSLSWMAVLATLDLAAMWHVCPEQPHNL